MQTRHRFHFAPPNLSRRAALGAVGALAAMPLALPLVAQPQSTEIRIQSARYPLSGPMTEGLVSTAPDAPPPVIRMRQHVPFMTGVTNDTPDYTAMHWHGLRVANGMDGVPYLTQFPIAEGERFAYQLLSPDAGTYWYHPHCMTMDQMARGLTGILIVEEAEDPGYDAEVLLNLRDFRLNSAGELIDLWTARGAARGGTFGTVWTTNWLQEPVYDAPAGGLIRLRIAATDTTRIYKIYLPDGQGKVVARDGHPLAAPVDLPVAEDGAVFLAPGQRADLAVVMPAAEGQTLTVMSDAPGPARLVATLRAVGPTLTRAVGDIRALPPNPIPEPDLASARREEFVFGWSPDGGLPNNGLCGTLGYTFWSINRTPWAGDAAENVGPLATFRQGESVILRLRNESPNDHPIHLHGLVFKPIRSNKRAIPPYWTDTALLLREETIDIAFVADNPGDWAFHCHVIEHQKTGLAGYIRVEG